MTANLVSNSSFCLDLELEFELVLTIVRVFNKGELSLKGTLSKEFG